MSVTFIANPDFSMGYRLPCEAEWEKAARGIDGRFILVEIRSRQADVTVVNRFG